MKGQVGCRQANIPHTERLGGCCFLQEQTRDSFERLDNAPKARLVYDVDDLPAIRGFPSMPSPSDLSAAILASWRTNSRVTAYLVEHISNPLWNAAVPGFPQRTIRSIAAHLHNARCAWIKTLGQENGIVAPQSVDRRHVTQRQLLTALKRSSRGIEALLKLGLASGGTVPATKAYVWRNLPLDVPHVVTYFVAHEGHHRGQIMIAARQTGHRLPPEISGGLWQWNKRMHEA